MKAILKIKRQESPQAQPYWQRFAIDESENTSIAQCLRALGERQSLADAEGMPVDQAVIWDCSCLEAKCGACAMLINGKPRLACDVFLGEVAGKGEVILAPLSKFPVVRDLMVDRTVVFDMLLQAQAWLDDEENPLAGDHELRFEANACLNCGCCLEVCPGFFIGGSFSGPLTAAAAYAPLVAEPRGNEHRADVRRAYLKSFYEGCGKSLACVNACAAHLPLEKLISRTNAAALYRRK